MIAGRVDHKGEDVSLLADLATDWDDAATRGPEGFAREVAAADRSRGRGGRPAGAATGFGSGNGYGNGDRRPAGPPGSRTGDRQPVPVGPGPAPVPASGRPATPGAAPVAIVSPLRTGAASPLRPNGPVADLPRIDPAPPVPSDLEPADLGRLGPEDEEPPLPDEATALVIEAAAAATVQVEAARDQVLHVRFAGGAGAEGAMETFRQVIRAHPGSTRVVIHVSGGRGGDDLPMELRTGVAYDSELLAEVGRRLGPSAIDLRLA